MEELYHRTWYAVPNQDQTHIPDTRPVYWEPQIDKVDSVLDSPSFKCRTATGDTTVINPMGSFSWKPSGDLYPAGPRVFRKETLTTPEGATRTVQEACCTRGVAVSRFAVSRLQSALVERQIGKIWWDHLEYAGGPMLKEMGNSRIAQKLG